MPVTIATVAPFLAALLAVLTALTIPPAQLAARSVLRHMANARVSRARAPAFVVGLGAGAAVAALLAGLWIGPNAAITVALLLLLALLATIDLAWRWLPWEWCGLIATLGGVQAVLNATYEPAAFGALVGGGLLLVLRTTYRVLLGIEALGLGDVWLTAAIGTFVGPIYIMWVLAAAACLGLLLHFASKAQAAPERGVAFGAHICAVTPFFLGL
ncbi:MAG: prepilin peptidase [Pseudomonadota bacterium]